jgi:hypothetical protein
MTNGFNTPCEPQFTNAAMLQQKKNAVRKALNEKGVLKRGGENKFDHYSYFSEAQYKQLFTELFSANGVELTVNVGSVEEIDGTGKQPFGRRVMLEMTLTDIETGHAEKTVHFGEGFDKGDKALYKAYTGAIKYYLADTFLVATGDDPETESPDGGKAPRKASQKQVELLSRVFQGERLAEMLAFYGVSAIEELTVKQASDLISSMKG